MRLGPFPLYIACIFEDLHALGGSWSIALLFRNDAMRIIPSLLICLRTYSGMLLRPELLFALKACCIMCVSSAGEMCWVVGSVIGVYSSSGRVGSWKSSRLWAANSCSLSAEMSASLDLSMLQNCLGRYFIMSGSSICNFARLRAQHCLYALYALWAGGLETPYDYLVCVQCCFAYLHSSLYHGAICFSHLLGFLFGVMDFFVITPAFTASSMRYSSIFSALRSLSAAYLSSIASNSWRNCVDAVCSRHLCALV